jgi:hypothetical protein
MSHALVPEFAVAVLLHAVAQNYHWNRSRALIRCGEIFPRKRDQRQEILTLAFLIRQAQHLLMTTATRRAKPTDGALRAAKAIERNPSFIESTAEVIDRETGVRELVEMLENIIAEAGDLIESRSPELVAHARSTLRQFSDEAPRHAE